MLTLLFTAALAQTPPQPQPAQPPPANVPPTDEQAKAAVDKLYGKTLPKGAVCVEHPTLPEPLTGHPTPVATKRGERGCVLVGVMVGGELLEPGPALQKAIDPAAFGKLDTATKAKILLAWTDEILLAFDRPSEAVPGTATATKTTATVSRRLSRRSERDLGIDDITITWKYDAALAATSTEVVNARWQTNFFSKPVHIDGPDQAAVLTALSTRGKPIGECFADLWATDPAAAGRVVLEWTVAAGKATGIAAESSASEPVNGPLAACYGREIGQIVWPADMAGRVRWSFAAVRGEIK